MSTRIHAQIDCDRCEVSVYPDQPAPYSNWGKVGVTISRLRHEAQQAGWDTKRKAYGVDLCPDCKKNIPPVLLEQMRASRWADPRSDIARPDPAPGPAPTAGDRPGTA